MRNIIKKFLLVLVLMLSACFLFACGESNDNPDEKKDDQTKEMTNLEKVLNCKVDNPSSAELTIKIEDLNDVLVYSKKEEYKLNAGKYDVAITEKTLGGLAEEEYVETTSNDQKDSISNLNLKPGYILEKENDGVNLTGEFTEAGLAWLGEGINAANIAIKTADGKIVEVEIIYIFGDNTVTIKNVYNY